VVLVLALAVPAVALAYYDEHYGGYTICGSPQGNCYIHTSGAHTFDVNVGSSVGSATYLACQLFNSSGVNRVAHDYGVCQVLYDGGAYVWGRVYNESAFPDTVSGYARTP
jgi:hypothetical protein